MLQQDPSQVPDLIQQITDAARVIGYIGLGAVGVIMFFVSIGNYMIDRKPIRLVECSIFVVIFTLFGIIILGLTNPPMIGVTVGALLRAILWLLLVILIGIWGTFLAQIKWREINTKESLLREALRVQKEKERVERENTTSSGS